MIFQNTSCIYIPNDSNLFLALSFVFQTPNFLGGTPSRIRAEGAAASGTPSSTFSGAGSSTPVRDQLSINANSNGDFTEDSERRQRQLLKRQLQAGLAELPAPKHDYTIIMPELPADMDESTDAAPEVDQADVLAAEDAQRRAEEQARLQRRSMAIQRELPRPLIVNSAADAVLRAQADTVEAMVSAEMMLLLKHDAIVHPPNGAPAIKKGAPNIQVFSDRQLKEARNLVAEQLKEDGDRTAETAELFARIEEAVAKDSLYLPTRKQYGFASQANKVCCRFDAMRVCSAGSVGATLVLSVH